MDYILSVRICVPSTSVEESVCMGIGEWMIDTNQKTIDTASFIDGEKFMHCLVFVIITPGCSSECLRLKKRA